MAKMFGAFDPRKQNSGGWSKSAMKRIEMLQELSDSEDGIDYIEEIGENK